jgi:hypothetical protein
MIIRYAKERAYDLCKEDESLTLGKGYIVLGITLEQGIHADGSRRKSYVTIQRDSDGYPCCFDIEFFDVIDPAIPDGWIFSRLSNGAYSLGPQEFEGNFWEKFHEGEPNEIEKMLKKHRGEEDIDAQTIFKEVVKKIQDFHGLLPQVEPEDPYAWPFKEYK